MSGKDEKQAAAMEPDHDEVNEKRPGKSTDMSVFDAAEAEDLRATARDYTWEDRKKGVYYPSRVRIPQETLRVMYRHSPSFLPHTQEGLHMGIEINSLPEVDSRGSFIAMKNGMYWVRGGSNKWEDLPWRTASQAEIEVRFTYLGMSVGNFGVLFNGELAIHNCFIGSTNAPPPGYCREVLAIEAATLAKQWFNDWFSECYPNMSLTFRTKFPGTVGGNSDRRRFLFHARARHRYLEGRFEFDAPVDHPTRLSISDYIPLCGLSLNDGAIELSHVAHAAQAMILYYFPEITYEAFLPPDVIVVKNPFQTPGYHFSVFLLDPERHVAWEMWRTDAPNVKQETFLANGKRFGISGLHVPLPGFLGDSLLQIIGSNPWKQYETRVKTVEVGIPAAGLVAIGVCSYYQLEMAKEAMVNLGGWREILYLPDEAVKVGPPDPFPRDRFAFFRLPVPLRPHTHVQTNVVADHMLLQIPKWCAARRWYIVPSELPPFIPDMMKQHIQYLHWVLLDSDHFDEAAASQIVWRVERRYQWPRYLSAHVVDDKNWSIELVENKEKGGPPLEVKRTPSALWHRFLFGETADPPDARMRLLGHVMIKTFPDDPYTVVVRPCFSLYGMRGVHHGWAYYAMMRLAEQKVREITTRIYVNRWRYQMQRLNMPPEMMQARMNSIPGEAGEKPLTVLLQVPFEIDPMTPQPLRTVAKWYPNYSQNALFERALEYGYTILDQRNADRYGHNSATRSHFLRNRTVVDERPFSESTHDTPKNITHVLFKNAEGADWPGYITLQRVFTKERVPGSHAEEDRARARATIDRFAAFVLHPAPGRSQKELMGPRGIADPADHTTACGYHGRLLATFLGTTLMDFPVHVEHGKPHPWRVPRFEMNAMVADMKNWSTVEYTVGPIWDWVMHCQNRADSPDSLIGLISRTAIADAPPHTPSLDDEYNKKNPPPPPLVVYVNNVTLHTPPDKKMSLYFWRFNELGLYNLTPAVESGFRRGIRIIILNSNTDWWLDFGYTQSGNTFYRDITAVPQFPRHPADDLLVRR